MTVDLKMPSYEIAQITDLSVALEPVQENDYDSVWPAGGGKNLVRPFAAQTLNGITVEMTADGEVWIHGTPSISSGHIAFNFEYFPESVINQTVAVSVNEKTVGVGFAFGSSNGSLNLTMADTVTSKTGVYTVTSTAGRFAVNVRYDVGDINKKYTVQLEIGSTPTAWQPYSNICPISGSTEVNVTRTGKNLVSSAQAASVGNNWQYFKTNGLRLKANTYTLSIATEVAPTFCYVRPFGQTQERIANSNSATLSFTLAKEQIVWFDLYWAGGTGKPSTAPNIQLELGSTATAYEPYQGETYSVELGDTVYGGTLDVTAGQLVIDKAIVDLTTGMTGGTAGSGYVWFKQLQNALTVPNSQIADIISEAYKPIRYNAVASNINHIALRDNGTIYVNTGSSEVQPIGNVVYALATPTTVQLTAQDVETLTGINNVWSDSGNVSVTIYGTTQTGDVVTVTALPQHKIQLFMP